LKSFLALVVVLLLALPAAAQEANPKQAELEQLTARIAAIETAIEKKADDDAALVALRVDLDTFSKALIDFGVSLRPRINEINRRLDELGPPPKQGDPAEPELLTKERTALQQEKAVNNTFLANAETLSVRANRAISRIGDLRRELFTNTLFQRTDIAGAIGSGTWSAFTFEMGRAWQEVSARLKFMFTFRPGSLFYAVGLSLVVGLATFLGVRRAISFMAQPGDGEDMLDGEQSYISKLSLAFWSTVVPSLAFAASLGVTFALFVYFDVFTVDTLNLAEALLISAAAIFFIQRLVNALFAPHAAERRLILVSDRAARVLVTLAVSLAVIHVLDYFLGRVFETLSSPLSLTVAKSLVSSLAISAVLIMVALVKPFHDRETGARRGWPRLVSLPILLVACFIIGAAVTGYIGLARFTAAQLVVTGAILATMYIGVQSGQVLASESVFPRSLVGHRLKMMFQLSDTALDQLGLLLSFVVYATVIIVGLPLILLQWGFNQLDIQTWLLRILTDIRIGNISISLVGIIFGIAIFILGFLLTRRFQRWLDGAVMARSRVDLGVRNSIRTIVGYAGIVFAALIGLSAAGFDLSSLALVAGALSLGIGFGLQNIVSNFVSGLILLAERPFKAGDWIVAGGTAGFVRKISVRATEIETFQHQTVILPNSELINSAVGNWTHRDRMGRLEIKVSAAYGVNPRKVHDLLLEIAAKDIGVLKNPAPMVVFTEFGESSLDFELRVHINEIFDGPVIGNRLRFEIFDAFARHDIAIPFPQRDVNLKLPDLTALSAAIDATRKKDEGEVTP
jgi:potassium efflux system protein